MLTLTLQMNDVMPLAQCQSFLTVLRFKNSLKLGIIELGLGLRQSKEQTERFKLSIIIITVFIKEPYTLEKALFECVYGARRVIEIHL